MKKEYKTINVGFSDQWEQSWILIDVPKKLNVGKVYLKFISGDFKGDFIQYLIEFYKAKYNNSIKHYNQFKK